MSYEWPMEVVRDADILAPATFNADLAHAAEQLNDLDAHNLQASSFATGATFGTGATGKIWPVVQVCDPDFGTPGAYQYPQKGVANVFQVQNNSQWQVISNTTQSNITTGSVELRVDAYIQYIWFDWLGTNLVLAYDHVSHSNSTLSQASLPCGLQVAVRIDGVVIEASIPGHLSTKRRDFWPVKAQPERAESRFGGAVSGTQPGPAQPKTPRIFALGPECMGVVIQCVVAVPPGTHTVELVARRPMPPSAGGRLSTATSDDAVYIYNRVVVVEEVVSWAPTSSTSAGLSVSPFTPDSALTTTSIYTNRMQTLVTAVNDLPQHAVRKHSLRYEHLPQILAGAASRTMVPALVQHTNDWYPGFTDTYAAAQTADTGWWLLNDGAGNDFNTTTTFAVSTVASYVRVRAHVHMSSVEDYTATPANLNAKGFFAAFAIAYKMNGSWNLIKSSINIVNSWNVCPISATANPEEMNIPLLGILDYSSSLGAFNITNIGVVACGFLNANYGGVWPRAKVIWKEGGITALMFRA